MPLLVIALSIGCGGKIQPPERPELSVSTQVVQSASRPRTRTLIGEFQARIESGMSFRTNGRIEERLAEIGDRVSVDDVLARLDSPRQLSDVQAAEAALRAAEAVLDEREANYDRIEQLVSTQSASEQEFDDAQSSLLSSKASVAIAAEALEMAETELSFTVLRATVAGVVIARYAEAGQFVETGTPVFTIAVDGDREVVFDVFPMRDSDMPEPDNVDLSLQSDPTVAAVGFIREISPGIDSSNGTVRVKVGVPDPPEKMTLGAAVVGVAHFKTEDVISLPWTALSRNGDRPAVWIVDPESRMVSSREIVVESYATGEMLIADGLVEGELVVTQGAQLIRPGQIVEIANQDAMQ